MTRLTRRDFLSAGTAVAGAALFTRSASAAPVMPPVCVFSKHLQFLDYAALAQTAKELGFDGIDLTVRSGGHVLPENVAVDLPRAVEAIRAAGLEVPMITTNLPTGDAEHTDAILRTASELGIYYFRCGGHSYSGDGDILAQLDAIVPEIDALGKRAAELGLQGGYHNHSGMNRVGAPVWDLHHLFEKLSNDSIGSNLDLGHATVEGAYGDWQITTRLLAPRVKMAAVKDFKWNQRKPRWVPLGEGLVPVAEYFEILRGAGFGGPISLHFEYDAGPNEALLDDMRSAAAELRRSLAKAGYA